MSKNIFNHLNIYNKMTEMPNKGRDKTFSFIVV